MPLKRVALLFLCAALGGCVSVREPVGDTPAITDPEAWDGHWIEESLGLVLNAIVTDRERGTLEVSWIESKRSKGEPPRMELVRALAVVRRSGDFLIVSMRVDERVEPSYLVLAAAKEGDRAVAWVLDDECVRALIRSGALPGTDEAWFPAVIDRIDVSQLVSRTAPVCSLLAWNKPLIFRRVIQKE